MLPCCCKFSIKCEKFDLYLSCGEKGAAGVDTGCALPTQVPENSS